MKDFVLALLELFQQKTVLIIWLCYNVIMLTSSTTYNDVLMTSVQKLFMANITFLFMAIGAVIGTMITIKLFHIGG